MVILKELQLVLMPTCFMSVSKEVFDKNRAGDTGEVREKGGRTWPLHFFASKKKKGKQRKKERHSKQKLLKGCHQAQNITVLTIL